MGFIPPISSAIMRWMTGDEHNVDLWSLCFPFSEDMRDLLLLAMEMACGNGMDKGSLYMGHGVEDLDATDAY